MEDYSDTDRIIKKLKEFDWLVFTSANAARFFFARLHINSNDTRSLSPVQVAAIGKTTAQRLTCFGIIADLVPEEESSAGLLEKFSRLEMSNKRVLLPQANVASCELSEGLVKLGAKVEEIPVYMTIEIDPGDIDFDHIDSVLFTSGSTVQAFVKKFGKLPQRIKA